MAGVSFGDLMRDYSLDPRSHFLSAENLIPLPPSITLGDLEQALRIIIDRTSDEPLAFKNVVAFALEAIQLKAHMTSDVSRANASRVLPWFRAVEVVAGIRLQEVRKVHDPAGKIAVFAAEFHRWAAVCITNLAAALTVKQPIDTDE